MNSTQQIGRLAADPEPLRTTEHGPVTTFRIARPAPEERPEGDDGHARERVVIVARSVQFLRGGGSGSRPERTVDEDIPF